MAKFYDALDDKLRSFIEKQHMFFTATAPQEGRINLSPKGMDAFRCLDYKDVDKFYTAPVYPCLH